MAKPTVPQGSTGLAHAAEHVPGQVTLPDLDTLFAHGGATGGPAATAGAPSDLDLHQPTPAPQATDHAAGGLAIAADHVHEGVTLPDVSSLTGLDFFPHG
jgi:hypothetical protein